MAARIDAFAEAYGKLYTSAVMCLLADREQLTSCLRFPLEHHKRIRHSKLIERTFGETRRWVKVIGRLPGQTSCLNLVWAVLNHASRGWRGPEHHQHRVAPAARPAPSAPRPAHPAPPNQPAAANARRHRQRRRLTFLAKVPDPRHLHRSWDAAAASCRDFGLREPDPLHGVRIEPSVSATAAGSYVAKSADWTPAER
jgi:Transposase, Mutator family